MVRVLGILGDCVGPLGLAGGQVMDLKSEGKPDVGMETLTWIHTHKTAALLKAAVGCGAVIAGATDDQVAKCEEYALKIGLAFQVRLPAAGAGDVRVGCDVGMSVMCVCGCDVGAGIMCGCGCEVRVGVMCGCV